MNRKRIGILFGGALLMTGWALTSWKAPEIVEAIREVRAWVPAPLFLVAMALLPNVGLPISLTYAAAGLLYPPGLAIGLIWTGLAANLMISYPIGHQLLRGPVESWLARRQVVLPTLSQFNQYRLIYLLRAVPGVPFLMQNYILAVLNVPFVLYFSISLVVQGLIGTAVALVSGGVLEGRPSLAIVGVTGLIGLGFAGAWFFRRWEKERRALENLKPE